MNTSGRRPHLALTALFRRGWPCLPFLFAATAVCFLAHTTEGSGDHSFAAQTQQGGFSFEERVAAQRRIEEVYWRHRIWPVENRHPKPTLSEVVPETALRAKVEGYLRKSAALERYWKRPITREQLQAEMRRMASQTKRPDLLRDLWAALGNNPYLVAECLARPLLADRLLHSWHGGKQSDGTSSFSSWWETASASLPAEVTEPSRDYHLSAMAADDACVDDTWTPMPGVIERSNHTAVWTGSEMIVWGGCANEYVGNACNSQSGHRYDPATDTWSEMNIEGAPSGRHLHTAIWTGTQMIVWGGLDLLNATRLQTGGRYDPIADAWLPTTINEAPTSRHSHTAVWAGSEMIIWGGDGCLAEPPCVSAFVNSGGRYNPATDQWTETNFLFAPDPRRSHSAVWTGSEMIVWGGEDGSSYLGTGGRYNPATDGWQLTSTAEAPAPRTDHTAIWTGSEMIIWGGFDGATIGSGGRYNPASNTWTATASDGAADPRFRHTAVWAGTKMVIWGGFNTINSAGLVEAGGRYDPVADLWQSTNTNGAPRGREDHTAVWTGSEMIVWGGNISAEPLGSGGRYDPVSDSWVPTDAQGGRQREQHTALWTGSEMIVWGGCLEHSCKFASPNPADPPTNTGARYDPATDVWSSINTLGAPGGRRNHAVVWTGTEMIVSGGFPSATGGGRYNPAEDSWAATGAPGSSSIRAYHTAVWTGNEMIVWGGNDCLDPPECANAPVTGTGERFNPATNSWRAMNLADAPSKRNTHSAVWTGSRIIVWGGYGCIDPPDCSNFGTLSSGGSYDPSSDSWRATSTAGAPSPRNFHPAVWTGSEMIVWGGGGYPYTNTGGRYNPVLDAWTATSTVGAPVARNLMTAVWTGSEMIIWGGYDVTLGGTNTGGRYDPAEDRWSATAIAGAPSRRQAHTAVWTGREMIISGGHGVGPTATGGRYCVDVPVSPVQLAGVVSRKVHGTVGTFEVNLPLTQPRGIECRSGGAGGDYTMIFTFTNALTNVDLASVASGTGSVSSSQIDSSDAHRYVVNLTGVANAQIITVSLTNVNDSAGNSSASVSGAMGVLVGDTTGDGAVSSSDISETKAQSGQLVTASNFRNDLTANGSTNSSDISLVKSKSGTALPVP